MNHYTDYSEPLLKVKALLRTMDDLLLSGKLKAALKITPEVIVELRMMQSMIAMLADKAK
tara:strand:- start:375 stop:554 length:180 start_codon:yes stop_codon:yes gene_type:complete